MFTTIATKSGYNDTHAHVQCVTYSGRRMDVRPLRRTHVHYVGRTSITPDLKGHTSSLRLTLVLLTSRRSGQPIGPLRQNLASKKKWVQQHFPATTLRPPENGTRPLGPLSFDVRITHVQITSFTMVVEFDRNWVVGRVVSHLVGSGTVALALVPLAGDTSAVLGL